jgi:predicted transposase/invertase (TIGR01784 family)
MYRRLDANLEMLKKRKMYEDGKKEKEIEIAKKMLNKNKPIEEIIEFTGLTKEEVENL